MKGTKKTRIGLSLVMAVILLLPMTAWAEELTIPTGNGDSGYTHIQDYLPLDEEGNPMGSIPDQINVVGFYTLNGDCYEHLVAYNSPIIRIKNGGTVNFVDGNVFGDAGYSNEIYVEPGGKVMVNGGQLIGEGCMFQSVGGVLRVNAVDPSHKTITIEGLGNPAIVHITSAWPNQTGSMNINAGDPGSTVIIKSGTELVMQGEFYVNEPRNFLVEEEAALQFDGGSALRVISRDEDAAIKIRGILAVDNFSDEMLQDAKIKLEESGEVFATREISSEVLQNARLLEEKESHNGTEYFVYVYDAGNSGGGQSGGNSSGQTPSGGGGNSFVRPDPVSEPAAPTQPAQPTIPVTEERVVRTVLSIGQTNFTATVNGAQTDMVTDVPPQIREGRVMMPSRMIAQLLGVNVAYDAATKRTTLTYGEGSVQLLLGASYMLVNGERVELTAPVWLTNGRMLLPLRDIQRAFDDLGLRSTIAWDNDTKSVTVERFA